MKRILIALAALAAPILAIYSAANAQMLDSNGYLITNVAPSTSNPTVCFQGMVYAFAGTGTQPNTFVYAPGGSKCGGGSTDERNPGRGLVGSPNSVQYLSQRTALDLESVDVEGDARFTDAGDSDTIGGAGTYSNASGQDGERLEGRYERNWRPFEGSRTRAIINVPLQLNVDNSGSLNVGGLLQGGLEIPVEPNWSVTPRAGIGGSIGGRYSGEDGVLGALSLGSRYRFPQVSRGDLVIGNMIAYTGESGYGDQNALLRNGVAYQWPLKQMVFGRQVSARISYVNTWITGNAVPYRDYNELAVNFGVRMREQDVRSRFELLRVGLLYTNAENYNAITLTAGYRF